MTDDQVYGFMTGLPRSGGTLLTSILNENPDVYSSPLSPLPAFLDTLHRVREEWEPTRIGTMLDNQASLVAHTIPAFYAWNPETYIIDKSWAWGTPHYLSLLTMILADRPRIVAPVRPLPQVVASLIVKARENPGRNFIDVEMRAHGFASSVRKPLDDARVDYLLAPGGMIDTAMLGLASAYTDEWADCFCLVRYDDLIAEPGKTLDRVSDHLGIPRYPYTFDAIAPSPDHDPTSFGIPDMLTVRPTLEITSAAPETVLSDYAMTRCLIKDFWTER